MRLFIQKHSETIIFLLIGVVLVFSGLVWFVTSKPKKVPFYRPSSLLTGKESRLSVYELEQKKLYANDYLAMVAGLPPLEPWFTENFTKGCEWKRKIVPELYFEILYLKCPGVEVDYRAVKNTIVETSNGVDEEMFAVYSKDLNEDLPSAVNSKVVSTFEVNEKQNCKAESRQEGEVRYVVIVPSSCPLGDSVFSFDPSEGQTRFLRWRYSTKKTNWGAFRLLPIR